MKYFALILMLAVFAGCRNDDTMEEKPLANKLPRQHQTLLLEIILHVNGGQPAAIDATDDYEAGGRPFIQVEYHLTETGQKANLLIEGPSASLTDAVVYACMGGCPCYTLGTIDPQGEYQVKCTCTSCQLVVYQYPAANVLFAP